MSSVEKRTRNGKTVWLARHRTPEGISKAPSYATRKEAAAFLATVDNDKLAGLYADPRLGDITVEAWGEDWFGRQSYDNSETARRVHNSLKLLYRCPIGDKTMGDKPLRSVYKSHLEAFIKWMKAEEYAPNTIQNTWAWVRAIFLDAVTGQPRRLPFSPCDGVKLHLGRTPDIILPTLEEIVAIHKGLPARWQRLALLGPQCGLRPGELLGLCKEQLVFTTREPFIRVDRQLHVGSIVNFTKTDNSYNRQVPLDPGAVDLINAQLAKYGTTVQWSASFKRNVERIFPVNNPRRTWGKAVVAAGIERQVRMHDMRHFYASHLYCARPDWKLVAARLGDTVETTMRVYAKLVPQSEELARGAMDTLFAPARVLGVY